VGRGDGGKLLEKKKRGKKGKEMEREKVVAYPLPL